jgi:hypothetical protein
MSTKPYFGIVLSATIASPVWPDTDKPDISYLMTIYPDLP